MNYNWIVTPEPKTTRELLFLVHPDDLQDEAAQDAFADDVADGIVALVEAERARQGLPPLTD